MKDYIVPIMVPDEKVFSEYTSSCYTIVFTNKRLIVIKPESFSKTKKASLIFLILIYNLFLLKPQDLSVYHTRIVLYLTFYNSYIHK